jgi:hypothetical protein
VFLEELGEAIANSVEERALLTHTGVIGDGGHATVQPINVIQGEPHHVRRVRARCTPEFGVHRWFQERSLKNEVTRSRRQAQCQRGS